MIPSLPEMIESVVPHFPEDAEAEINNISSGMFNMFLGIGQIMGPMYGAIVTTKYDFRFCSDSVSMISLIFSIIYYIFGNGKEAFKLSRWVELPTFSEVDHQSVGFNIIEDEDKDNLKPNQLKMKVIKALE